MKLMNRFMRSPTMELLADPSGKPKPKMLRMMEKLAEGRVGLIVPGGSCPIESCKANSAQICLYKREQVEPWVPTIKKCQKLGSKIVFQVACASMNALDGQSRGPSPGPAVTKVLSVADIEDIIDGYRKASVEVFAAGADGIQIHAAHGLLVSTFLSPLTNHRTDKYGGSPEGRLRIVSEIAEEVRKATDRSFAIAIKMNGTDGLPGGIEKELCAEYVHMLKGKVDLFEISRGLGVVGMAIEKAQASKSGSSNAKPQTSFVPLANEPFAAYVKKMNPWAIVSTVEGVRTLDDAEKVLKAGSADLVSLSRPLLREPTLIRKWEKGEKRTSDCISCNACLMKFFEGKPIQCAYP